MSIDSPALMLAADVVNRFGLSCSTSAAFRPSWRACSYTRFASSFSSITETMRRPPMRIVSVIEEKEEAKRSEEHTSELQSRSDLVCRLLLETKKKTTTAYVHD